MARSFSLRTKFLLTVLGGALIPLSLLGVWLNRGTERSGEALVRTRLDSALIQLAVAIGSRWTRERSVLLSLTEDEGLRRRLITGSATTTGDLPLVIAMAADSDLRHDVAGILIRDAQARARWSLEISGDTAQSQLAPVSDTTAFAALRSGALPVTIPIYESAAGSQRIGAIEVWLRASSLQSVGAERAAGVATVIAIGDSNGTLLTPVPFDPASLSGGPFGWAGGRWLSAQQRLEDPPLTIAAAASLDPFTQPFAHAARVGAWMLLVMILAVLLVTWSISGRLTRSLQQLAAAADAVSHGDLDRRIEPSSNDEIGRAALAFNTMTENLRRTLRLLSERESVAAVGEFASILAHEIRNPLGAMRLRLQSLEERLGEDPRTRAQMGHALSDIGRLEATVAGALQLSRSGRVTLGTIDVRGPVNVAMQQAQAEFDRRGAVLDDLECTAASTAARGDSAALERVVLNLLLNAAQAMQAGQHAGVLIEPRNGRIMVQVWDRGSGIAPEVLNRVFEPFYSAKPEGTGLGLAIVKQVVAAHGGELDINSEVGKGTLVSISLVSAT